MMHLLICKMFLIQIFLLVVVSSDNIMNMLFRPIPEASILTEEKTKTGLFFVHMRKCGGSSIGEYMRLHMRPCCQEACPLAGTMYKSDEIKNWNCDFYFRETEFNYPNLGVLSNKSIVSITHLRDPIDRIISQYLYIMDNDELKSFLARKTSDPLFYKKKMDLTALFQRALRNETMWNSFLNTADKQQPPRHLYKQYIPNYFSKTLSSPIPQVKGGGHKNAMNAHGLIPIQIKSTNDLINILLQFTYVLTDLDSRWKEIISSLMTNTFSLPMIDQKMTEKNVGPTFANKRSYVPASVLKHLVATNEKDIELYNRWIRQI